MKFYLGSAILALALLAACSDDNSSSPAPESSSAQESSISDVASSSSEVVQESSSSESAPESSAEIESSESSADTVWNRAALTWYTSWPEPGSEECEDYNGCTWAGWFAGLEDQQTEEWVSEHNIIAIHEKDWNTYKLKTFRLRKGGYTIDAVVYDKCADSDCDGCCTKNAGELGFLIDIESYTCERLSGTKDGCDGVIEWTCLDCE
ncbi:hypothetical protein [Fibrobacter sp. UWB1]|uniref:hypothetical protein n=1 Tax=unclassified Fibrobacter TaxID=2634177 RepID=UPI0020161DE5|nr:hypothetical protein [Fibrobacter sp. UWB1]